MRPGQAFCCLTVCCLFATLVPTISSGSPVDSFIVGADSSAAVGTDALDKFIEHNSILAGAAVGKLLDDAMRLADSGDGESVSERMTLAERIAKSYERQTGSDVPLGLFTTYQNWTDEQRAQRRVAGELVSQGRNAQNRRDFETAAQHFNDAKSIYETIGDDRSVAIIWGTFGVMYWIAGDYDAVRVNYGHALEARRAVEDRILEGKTLNGMGSVNMRTGNLPEAEKWYAEAVALRTKTGDVIGLATSLTYLGNVYLEQRQLADARDQFEKARPVVEAFGSPRQRSEFLSSVATLSTKTGHLRRAEQAGREALDLAISTGDVPGQILVRNNLVGVLQGQGRYREALDEVTTVEELLRLSPDPAQRMQLQENRSALYIELGETDLAHEELVALLADAERVNATSHQIRALINFGYLNRNIGEFKRGLSFTERALPLAKAAGDHQLEREAMVLTASLQRNVGNYEAALVSFETALELDHAAGADALVFEDEIGIANVVLAQGEIDTSRKQYRSLMRRIDESGIHTLRSAARFGMGHTFENENPDSAAAYYESALTLLEDTRSAVGGAEVRTGFLSTDRRFYYEEVTRYFARVERAGAYPEGQWLARAFHTIERAKARGLVDLLDDRVLAISSDEEDKILDEIYRVRSQPESEERRSEERRLRSEYVEARENRLHAVFAPLGTERQIVGLHDVQNALPDGALVLEYALGDTASLLFAIARDGAAVYDLPGRDKIGALVDRLRFALKRTSLGSDLLLRTSYKLHQAVLAPVEDQLQQAGQVIVVPDGVLFELPFEVLINSETAEGTPWQDVPFLARSLAPVYVPSASVFLRLSRPRSVQHSRDLVAFGDPPYDELEGRTLPPLPNTRSEVLAVSSRVDKKRRVVYLGADASETMLKKEINSGSSRIVHLATHGLVDPMEPAASSVVLAPDPEAGEDGYLYALEILALPFETDLVVVSACETATGKIGRGEGVVGLSRSFLAAGSRAVVASLWAVSDESTAELMQNFYESMIKDKQTAADALNEARLAMMNDSKYAHPFHWSAFVFIGADRSLMELSQDTKKN